LPLESTYYSHGRLEPFFNKRDSIYPKKNLNHGELDYSVIQKVRNFGLIYLEASFRTSNYELGAMEETETVNPITA